MVENFLRRVRRFDSIATDTQKAVKIAGFHVVARRSR
jgi:hypothetical protein